MSTALQREERMLDDRMSDLVKQIETAEEVLRQEGTPAYQVNYHKRLILESKRAMDRIHKGHYGTCVDCHGEIPESRLIKQPHAERCVACQSAHEKT